MSETSDSFTLPFKAPDWYTRLIAEHQETEGRLTKLKAYLATNPTHIGDTQLALLKQQEKVMQEYANILYKRLAIAQRDLQAEHEKKESL